MSKVAVTKAGDPVSPALAIRRQLRPYRLTAAALILTAVFIWVLGWARSDIIAIGAVFCGWLSIALITISVRLMRYPYCRSNLIFKKSKRWGDYTSLSIPSACPSCDRDLTFPIKA